MIYYFFVYGESFVLMGSADAAGTVPKSRNEHRTAAAERYSLCMVHSSPEN